MNIFGTKSYAQFAWKVLSVFVALAIAVPAGVFIAPQVNADAPIQKFSASTSPTTVTSGATQAFTVTFTNDPTSADKIKAGRVTLPSGFTYVSTPTPTLSGVTNWSICSSGQEIQFGRNSGGTEVAPGSSFSITFTANVTASAGSYTVNARAFKNDSCNPGVGAEFDSNQTPITVIVVPTTPSNQTITFGSLSGKTYGDADFALTATSDSGLTVTYTASGPCSVTGSTVTITGTGSCTITAHQSGNSSYNAAPDVSQSFNIAARPITVTADAKSKTYGTSDPALTYGVTGTLVGSDSFTGALTRDPGEDVGNYSITQGTLALSSNYSLTYVPAALAINTKATLTVTANNQTITYGDSDPSFTFQYSGFVNGDTSSVIDTPPTCSISSTHSDAGNYAIVCSGGSDNNYDFSYDSGSLTVGKADATDISVTPYSVTYDGAAHTAVAVATGVNGEDLSGSFDLSGTTHTNAGSYSGDAWTFNGGTNYNNQNGTVDDVIAKADATVSVTPYTVTYDGNSHTAVGSATGVNDESLTGLDLSGTTHTNVGTYSEDPWTFTDSTGNYNNQNGTVSDVINAADEIIPPPPSDACPNIEGTQSSVPEGYSLVDGQCVANQVAPPPASPPPSGGGGGGQYGTCNDGLDNDQDGKTDLFDPQCLNSSMDEGNPPPTGQVLGASTVAPEPEGKVLGAATEPAPACADVYLTDYIMWGRKHNASQVEKLQTFLNEYMSSNLPVTGYYGKMTRNAVMAFQLKYSDQILAPWVPFGLTNSKTPTGHVYKTTKWYINKMKCDAAAGEQPQLP